MVLILVQCTCEYPIMEGGGAGEGGEARGGGGESGKGLKRKWESETAMVREGNVCDTAL